MDISTLVNPLDSSQEAYEKIFRHFSEPGVVFGFDKGSCVYRGDGGNPHSNIRCAIGCLMPDSIYEAATASGNLYEGMAGYEAIDLPETRDFFANVDADFLNEAQGAHDSETQKIHPSPDRFLLSLNRVAEKHNLRLIAS